MHLNISFLPAGAAGRPLLQHVELTVKYEGKSSVSVLKNKPSATHTRDVDEFLTVGRSSQRQENGCPVAVGAEFGLITEYYSSRRPPELLQQLKQTTLSQLKRSRRSGVKSQEHAVNSSPPYPLFQGPLAGIYGAGPTHLFSL